MTHACRPSRAPFGAVAALRRGGVVAYPTEAVYGLGCMPTAGHALQRIIDIKSRDAGKGMILIGADAEQLLPWVDVAAFGGAVAFGAALDVATVTRPTTWIVPAAAACPDAITGGRDTVAVRITTHPVAAGLCVAVGSALTSTSANRSGRPPIRRPLPLRREFGADLDAIVATPVGTETAPSRIVDFASGTVLRP